MARAKAVACMGLFLGAALAPAATASVPVAVLNQIVAAAPAQSGESRLTRAHNALNLAIDAQRQGRYEQADVMFREAQAGQQDLTAEERQDLANRMKANAAALQARHEGDAQLERAEAAYKAGRTGEAEDLLKKVIANTSVTPDAKRRAMHLAGAIRPRGTDAATAVSNALPQARAKVQQARAMVNRFDFEGAEQLALEAKRLHAPFTASEDSPDKVLSEVAQLRADPKALLAGARNACERGDYDRAERYAHMAEKKESAWTVHWRGDSPSKVLKDVQAGRARMAQKPMLVQNTKPMEVAPAVKETVVNPPRVDTTVKSTPPAPTGPAMPAKSTSPYGVTTVTTTTSPIKVKVEDPAALMQQAKDLMASGNLEEAAKVAYRAKAAQQPRTGLAASWQLFEDTPDKLIKDINKARLQRDQESSWRILADGRNLLEAGDLDGAAKCAYKAQNLHGPYSIMELGDRPNKLLADIQTARARQPKTAVAKKDDAKPQGSQVATITPPKPDQPLTSALPGAKPAATSGSPFAMSPTTASPPKPAVAAGPAGPDLGVPAPPTPVVSGPMQPVAKPLPTVVVNNSGPAAPPALDMNKLKAQALLSDARALQHDGKLIEARQKALECQRLNVTYGPNEDRPEQALVQLSALAGKKVDSLMAQAEDFLSNNGGNADKLAKAESNLVQARQYAVGFGLDCFRIDAKLGQCRQNIAHAKNPTPTPMPVVTTGYQSGPAGKATATDMMKPTVAPVGVGSDMLARARLELRSGHSAVARRLAEEALRGNYGVKMEAETVLRDINREEYNQSVLSAGRTFEAGAQAFNRHDYAQASAILRTIDPQLLEPAKQGRLKEYMGMPEMQPRAIQQAAAVGVAAPGAPRTADSHGPTVGSQPSNEASFATQVQALQDVHFQELREEGQQAQRQAMKLWSAGDTGGALDVLQDYLGKLTLQVGGGQMDPDRVAMLRVPVENRLKHFKTLKAQQDFEKEQNVGKEAVAHSRSQIELEHQAKKKQISELMKKFNSLYESAKYDEAEVAALQAKDLEPDNAIITAAITMARMHRNKDIAEDIKKEKADQWLHQANDADRTGPAVDSKNPILFDKDTWPRANKRKPLTDILVTTRGRAQQEIERKLTGQVSMSFKDKPLGEVLGDFRTMYGVNIVPDKVALDEAMVSLEQPMSMTLDNIPLKSALSLVLRDAKLTYVFRDDVLQVTTEKNAKEGKLVSKVYQVTDLVTPIQNATMPNPQAPRYGLRATEMSMSSREYAAQRAGGVQPYTPPNSLVGGQSVGTSPDGYSMSQSLGTPHSSSDPHVEKGYTQDTIQDQLISLIKNTIAPNSWNDAGGPGTLEYYPLGQSLVINQTPDIQEQIQDLLSALRRLQDQEVAIEVRMITVAESFYERIGIDFNINIKTDQLTRRQEPLLVTGNFKPGTVVNDFSPDRFISGLTPAGTFTSDLDIPIHSSSFGMAIPPFGAFPNLPGGNGGLDLGIAFLSDIQVFLFMEAAQGDARTHVMQAPKLTMFNGQTASITVADEQFFTADLNVIIVGSQIAFAPTNTLFPTGGITMFVRAAISGDRRFVRLDMTPRLFNLASAVVPLIPVVTPIFPATFEGGQVQNPVIFTQFIQQPAFNTITVMTSVAVPDGGTVLMGGLKRLSEGRNEMGPPVLSKIPYINRLFKNVGYGREVESIMMMVTPRIIIQEEEEERQTGSQARQERLSGI